MSTTDPLQLPPGLLLDLDDTILTYDAVSGEAWLGTCHVYADRCGVPAERLHEVLDQVRHWYWSDPERNRLGRLRLDETRREITRMGLQRLGIDDLRLASGLAADFRRRRDGAIGLFPGAREALAEFGRRGIRLALVTNGQAEHQRAKIERFNLEPYFRCLCIEGELGFGKPDPRVFERALSDLKLRRDEVWMVGDNLEWDIAGAQQVGIFGVWNDYRRRGLPDSPAAVPDHIIHGLSDLVPTEGP